MKAIPSACFFVFVLCNVAAILFLAGGFFGNMSPEEKIAAENMRLAEYLSGAGGESGVGSRRNRYDLLNKEFAERLKTPAERDILEDFLKILKIRKTGKSGNLLWVFDRLDAVKNPYRKAAAADELVWAAVFANDFDAALSMMNYSRKTYEWFVLFTYLYYESPTKSFFRSAYHIKRNEYYFKLASRLSDKQVWGMVCSMPYALIGGLYKSSAETAILAFDDYRQYLKTGVPDFSKSLARYEKDYKPRRTFQSAKTLAGFLYLAGQKQKALEVWNTINDPAAKIQAAALLVNLASVKGNAEDAKTFFAKLSIINKIRIYLFL